MRLSIKALILCAAALWGGVGAAGAAEIILYGRANFQGQSVTLNESAPDLRNYDFDNDLESFRVISGTWRIFRDANYQSNSGPSLTVGPGDYPNIGDLDRPRNRMSSVRLIVDPVAANCPAPYQVPNPDGVTCTFVCASGTVPDRASGECVCRPGWVEASHDFFQGGRLVCRPPRVEQPPPDDPVIFEPPPLPQALWIQTRAFDIDERARMTRDREVSLGATVATSEQLFGARLEYRAVEGPRVIGEPAMRQLLANAPWRPYRDQFARLPRPIAFEISAGAGVKYVYFQVRARTTDASGAGAWIVSAPSTDAILHEPSVAETPSAGTYNVPAGAAYAVARNNRFSFLVDPRTPATGCDYQTMAGGALGLNVTYEGSGTLGQVSPPVACLFRMFSRRQLAAGWSFFGRIELDSELCAKGQVEFRNESYGEDPAFQIGIIANVSYRPDPATTCLVHRWTISHFRLRGPAGADWRDAFR